MKRESQKEESGLGRVMLNVPIRTGVACAIFPTSSSACMSFLIRAAMGFFLGPMLLVGRFHAFRLILLNPRLFSGVKRPPLN